MPHATSTLVDADLREDEPTKKVPDFVVAYALSLDEGYVTHTERMTCPTDAHAYVEEEITRRSGVVPCVDPSSPVGRLDGRYARAHGSLAATLDAFARESVPFFAEAANEHTAPMPAARLTPPPMPPVTTPLPVRVQPALTMPVPIVAVAAVPATRAFTRAERCRLLATSVLAASAVVVLLACGARIPRIFEPTPRSTMPSPTSLDRSGANGKREARPAFAPAVPQLASRPQRAASGAPTLRRNEGRIVRANPF